MIVRLTVCAWCRRMLLDGEPPAEFGSCISCGERITREHQREESTPLPTREEDRWDEVNHPRP